MCTLFPTGGAVSGVFTDLRALPRILPPDPHMESPLDPARLPRAFWYGDLRSKKIENHPHFSGLSVLMVVNERTFFVYTYAKEG